ncbi:MAG: PDZ domain-containing protein [Candidatus Acidiferrales bacterium]
MRRAQIILGSVLALLLGILLHPNSSANTQAAAQKPAAPPARFAFGGNASEIPAEFVENLIFVPVDISKSQPSLFILDSTAAESSISPGRAAELGLASLQDPVLNFPGVDMPFASLATADKQHFSTEVGRPYQGTLGADFFSRVVVEIDYARQTLRLFDPSAYKYSGKGTVFPVKLDGGKPVIGAKFTLPGQKTHEGEFVVDTALDASLLISERFAETHRVFSSHLKTINASDPEIDDGAIIALGRLTEFQIGRYGVQKPIAAFVRQNSNSEIDRNRAGVIGAGMLRRFTVIFDYAHQQLILDPNTHFADYEQEDKSGIAVVAKGPGLLTFEVASVQPGTPGADAGVLKGDVIAGIDDEAAADLTLASIRNLFRQVGHKYKLLIQRNGQSVQVTVQMRRLI